MKFLYLCSTSVLKTFVSCQTIQFAPKAKPHYAFKRLFCTRHYYTAYNTLRNISNINATSNVQLTAVEEISSKIDMEHDALMHSLKNHTELLQISPIQWEACFKELKSNGFSVEDSLLMVTKCPPLLRLRVNDLATVFRHWRGVNLGEKYILSLLKTCPQLLLVPGREISLRLSHFKPLGSNKSIVDLLKGAPILMIEDWSEVVAKLSYLVDEMKMKKKHVVKSFALNRSVLFLKTRFTFLMRCGKFEKSKDNPDNIVLSKNPPLRHIVETNDVKFATEVAGLSLEEYEVFQELYALEMEEIAVSDSDSE